ncbi:MAG TPA: peptidylprolyl isomerase [Blastocatellia bacterium]|nr:peptidylprolyl isomerase [Blastocatellia bacterium]
MLRFFAKRKRSRNILLYGFIFLMTIGLVGFFSILVSGNKGFFASEADDDSSVAKVAGYKITVGDLRTSLAFFGKQMSQSQPGASFEDPTSLYGLYGPQVLERLVRDKLILYEADQIGLSATDAEVQTRLAQIFNPWPGYSEYKHRVTESQNGVPGYTVDMFEDGVRSQICEEKLRSYVTAGITISPKDVEDDYKKTNTSYSVNWVEVTADKFKDQVQVSDAALQDYFNQHKQDFHVNGEQRRARYILIDQTVAGQTIQVSDDDLKKQFNPERGVKQVRVSEIVLNVPKQTAPSVTGSPDDDIKKKADAIAAEATGSANKPAEDFAKLARQNSDDPKTKAKGGDLGWVNKDDKREPDDPLSRVFTMKKDEVTPAIKKGDAYYILKVTDRKLPTFEESREQLLKEARATKGYSKAVDIATEAEKNFKSSKNADAVVAQLNKEYGATVASVNETPYFATGDTLPGLGAASSFESAVFEFSSPGQIGEHLSVTNGFAIPQYVDSRGPHDAVFEDVKSKVEEKFRADKAKEIAAQKAQELAKAPTPDALKTLAESMGLKADNKEGITGNDPIGPLMTDENRASVYKLDPGHVTPEPIKEEDGSSYAVVGLISRKDADMGEPFQKQKKSIEDRLLQAKQETLFSTLLQSAEKRLKDQGKIKIYQSVVDAVFKTGEPATPGIPGIPGGGQPGGSRPPFGAGRPGRPVRRAPPR